jgi:hypothetical protein
VFCVLCAYFSAEPGDWALKFGYLDAKPVYTGRGVEAGEIHIKIVVGSFNIVWFCGLKESLKNAAIMVDLNVKAPANGNWSTYTPSPNRVAWEKKKYVGNECKSLLEVPEGTHVVSISTAPLFPHHESTLTHVITWQ